MPSTDLDHASADLAWDHRNYGTDRNQLPIPRGRRLRETTEPRGPHQRGSKRITLTKDRNRQLPQALGEYRHHRRRPLGTIRNRDRSRGQVAAPYTTPADATGRLRLRRSGGGGGTRRRGRISTSRRIPGRLTPGVSFGWSRHHPLAGPFADPKSRGGRPRGQRAASITGRSSFRARAEWTEHQARDQATEALRGGPTIRVGSSAATRRSPCVCRLCPLEGSALRRGGGAGPPLVARHQRPLAATDAVPWDTRHRDGTSPRRPGAEPPLPRYSAIAP